MIYVRALFDVETSYIVQFAGLLSQFLYRDKNILTQHNISGVQGG